MIQALLPTLTTFLSSVVAFVVVLGLMILVHELGHFLAARFFGIRVDVFSFGFGPRLLGKKVGDTDYRLSALPLGGYVKMAGDNPSEDRAGAPNEFLSKPRWQRMIVAVMGPVMNILLAIVLLAGLYMYRYEKPASSERPAEVGGVVENTPASRAGLEIGDRILRIDGIDEPRWEDAEVKVLTSPGVPLELNVSRGERTFRATLTPEPRGRSRVGYAGWYPREPVVIDAVEKGLPADQAGLRAGDQITAVDGQPIGFWPLMSEVLQRSGGSKLVLTVQRGGEVREVEVTPVHLERAGETKWRIGISFRREMISKRLPPLEAIRQSLETNARYAGWIFEIVARLFERKLGLASLEGPIGIARVSGEAARQGLPELIGWMAAISLNLGILNLLPIPILDGGHILLLSIESAMRRDMSLAVKERIVQVAYVFLMLIFAIVMYNDILKILPQ